MKRSECSKGMTVRDTRSGAIFKVIGERVHASDCGAWVEDVKEGADGVKDVWVIHWSFLEGVRQ